MTASPPAIVRAAALRAIEPQPPGTVEESCATSVVVVSVHDKVSAGESSAVKAKCAVGGVTLGVDVGLGLRLGDEPGLGVGDCDAGAASTTLVESVEYNANSRTTAAEKTTVPVLVGAVHVPRTLTFSELSTCVTRVPPHADCVAPSAGTTGTTEPALTPLKCPGKPPLPATTRAYVSPGTYDVSGVEGAAGAAR